MTCVTFLVNKLYLTELILAKDLHLFHHLTFHCNKLLHHIVTILQVETLDVENYSVHLWTPNTSSQ